MEIIAEIGQNHNGDMKLAIELIRQAKKNGADAAKFQLYDARRLFPKENNPWYEYNCQTELTFEQANVLNDSCKKLGIEFVASVFDIERVDWLEKIGVKRYKIASRSINDAQLIKRLADTGKPLIISLGMWEDESFPVISTQAKVDFLYCVSKYPAQLSDMYLKKVDFGVYAGLSDHTIGRSAAMAAFARGAEIVEKHFTLDKAMYGPDHAGSMDPEDLLALNNFRNDLKELLK